MDLNYRSLFRPYTKDGHKLENSINWLYRECTKYGVPRAAADLAVQEIFMEVNNGRIFPMDHCDCGCGLDSAKAGTAITHAFRTRALEIAQVMKMGMIEALQKRHNNSIKNYVENTKFLEKVYDSIKRYDSSSERGDVSDSDADGS